MANQFRDKLENGNDFLLTFELVPGRTARGRSVQKVLSFAQQAAQDGLLDALSIIDNCGYRKLHLCVRRYKSVISKIHKYDRCHGGASYFS